MIKLVSTFLNSEGEKHQLNIKKPDVEKSPEEIRAALGLLTELDIFEQDGTQLFQQVVSAKFVETIETPIFNQKEFFSDPNQPLILNQSVLILHDTALEVNEPEEIASAGDDLKPALQHSSTYKEMPEVPAVTIANAVPQEAGELQLEKAPPPTNVLATNPIKKLFRRRKAKRRRRKSPSG